MSTSDITCRLCAKEYQPDAIIITGICGHETCSECLVNYVTQNIGFDIKCPLVACEKQIPDRIIRQCLSNNQIIYYDQLSIKESSSQLKKCPIDECPFVYVYEEAVGIYECGYCESPICIKCDDNHLPTDCHYEDTKQTQSTQNSLKLATDSKTNHNQEDYPSYEVYTTVTVICAAAFIAGGIKYLAISLIAIFVVVAIIFLRLWISRIYGNLYPDKKVSKMIKENTSKLIRGSHPRKTSRRRQQKNTYHDRAKEIIKQKRHQENIEHDSKYDLLPNPNKFCCSFCNDFILPRNGVILRSCLHCFCRKCLEDTYSNKNFTNQLRCQICNTKLRNIELQVLIGEKRFVSMIIDEASCILFHCKSADCNNLLDVKTDTKSFRCYNCYSDNCIACNYVHENMTCEQFKKSGRYHDCLEVMETLKSKIHVSCHYCKNVLIQEGGCGALHCSTCGNHICVFTGLFAGQHAAEKCGCLASEFCERQANYCNCSSEHPCNVNCKYGCYPE